MTRPPDAEIDATAGCYVHLPFCDRICPYCDFAVVTFERRKAKRYVDAIVEEVRRAPAPRAPVTTVFLGGGTPSALEADDVERVLAALFARFAIVPGSVECTLEANPSRNVADLPAWRRAGVTRLSVGVQSLDDGDLHRLGRDHSADDAATFVRAARSAGFDDVSIDLIAGAPGQSPATFADTLDRALDLHTDHVSVYALTVEAGTPFATWHEREPDAFPDDDAVADMLEEAHRRMTSAGFVHYEISNFAMPGHECAHNIGYWRQRDCLAFGLSAAGYEDGLRYRNVRGFAEYCAAVESGLPPLADQERLDPAARLGEAAMLALRTAQGIDAADFDRRFGVDVFSAFADALKKCEGAELIEVDERGARLTGRGRLVANAVCQEFLRP